MVKIPILWAAVRRSAGGQRVAGVRVPMGSGKGV
jgi:hypothetical protein